MIDQSEVIAFFDALAPTWDESLEVDSGKIMRILDTARVAGGSRVLDVACGTGVLIPFYLARQAASVTAVDISPEMIRAAQGKCSDPRVRFLRGDAAADDFDCGGNYDAIVVYNAFPHFPRPEQLIRRLSGLLVPGGILTVAHGAGRQTIDAHHSGTARRVSNGLPPADEVSMLFARYLRVTAVTDEAEIYQVAGEKA